MSNIETNTVVHPQIDWQSPSFSGRSVPASQARVLSASANIVPNSSHDPDQWTPGVTGPLLNDEPAA